MITDQEVICTWMEPNYRLARKFAEENPNDSRTPGGWWSRGYIWSTRRLDLDALWEVEERLTDEQWQAYVTEVSLICFDSARGEMRYDGGWSRILLHATPEQKIKALAAALRPEVERD